MFEGYFQVRHDGGWNNDNKAAIFTWADRDFLSYSFLFTTRSGLIDLGYFLGSVCLLIFLDQSIALLADHSIRCREVVGLWYVHVHSTTLRAIQVQIHLLHISP